MSKSYAELLKDPRWQKIRLEVFQRADWQCQQCSDKTTELHVHHTFYDGREPWEYPENSLKCLCKTCHNSEHNKKLSNKVSPKLPEKVSAKVTSKKKLETTFTDEYNAVRQKWLNDLRKIEQERIHEYEKAERQNAIKEWWDEQDRLESIRNPSPDEIERRKKLRQSREKDEDHDRRLYGWNG